MLEVVNCKCEAQKDPLGIDTRNPGFSWQLHSDEPNVLQTGYRIKVTKKDQPDLIVWDSEWVACASSIGIRYEGQPLESRTAYQWQVTVTDNDNREATSGWASFEMAFLKISDWSAKWISPDLPGLPEEKEISLIKASLFPPKRLPEMIPCTMLHKEFRLEQDIRRARLYVTAHGLYKLLINGKKVGDRELTPEFSAYQKVLYYQVYDVTSFLKPGINAIGVVISDGWYCGHIGFSGNSRQYGDKHALLLQLEVEYQNDKKDVIVSDESFVSTNEGPIRYSDLFIGECYDARKEIPGFSQLGLDVSGWKGVTTEDFDFDNLCAFYGEPVRRVIEFSPKSVLTTPKEETVIDLGQNIAGRMKMLVSGEKNTEIILEHSEVLDEKGNFLMNIAGVNKLQRDTYMLKGEGTEEFEPQFTYHGFRYVRVTGYPGRVSVDHFKAVVIASDLDQTGLFTTSDQNINQLQSNIYWSQLGNMVSIPTDCPQREKMGWTGDIQVYCPTAAFNQNVASFLKRWLQSLRADQYDDGEVPFLSPFIKSYRDQIARMLKMISCAGWSDACIIVPYELYNRYGDLAFLTENYDTMTRWMCYVEKSIESGQWFKQFHYGDWLIPSVTKGLLSTTKSANLTREFVATAYYARTTDLMRTIAGLLNQHEDEKHYRDQNDFIRTLFKERYIAENGRFKPDLQGMYVLALRFGLIPEHLKQKYAGRLAELIKENNDCLDTGFLSTPFLLDVLCENGMTDLACQLLFQDQCPSWLYEVKSGATTIWESWNAITPDGKRRQNLSYNHYAFGCVGDFMYRRIAGINFLEPGYKKIKICPQTGFGFTNAQAQYHSVYGPIQSKWKIKDGKVSLNIEIPCNTNAVIELSDVGTLIDSNLPLKIEGRKATGETGSGSYSIVYELAE
ncbi:MAG: family 78 glycoside hydrolase catalytic domain [Clostridia bacterium]|nr:family 78 glycoside hydrolase catalytic domain [Clostridia bacterium]